jgi:methionyl-tRNA formyltransferase
MNEIKALLLCGNRIAMPVIRDLFFAKQIAAIAIPEHCTEFIQQVQILLKDSGVPVIVVNKKNLTEKLQQAIETYQPALGIVFGFSYKIPAAVYTIPVKGFYNIHPGPLPAYRGPDPVFRQVKNKEPYASVTIHKVDADFDSGAIVLSDKIRLPVTDTHGLLTTKLAELATTLVGTLMKMAAFDMDIPSRKQDESKAQYYDRQAAGDISINWQTMNAASIIALINACNPWNKGAVTKINNNIIRLLAAHNVEGEENNALPGTIISINDRGIVVTDNEKSAFCITLISCDEGFLMAGRLKEFAIAPGNRFGDV